MVNVDFPLGYSFKFGLHLLPVCLVTENIEGKGTKRLWRKMCMFCLTHSGWISDVFAPLWNGIYILGILRCIRYLFCCIRDIYNNNTKGVLKYWCFIIKKEPYDPTRFGIEFKGLVRLFLYCWDNLDEVKLWPLIPEGLQFELKCTNGIILA